MKYFGFFCIIILIGCKSIDVNRLSDINMGYNETREMINELSIIISREPKNWKAYYYRGIAYSKIGENNYAKCDITKSINLNQNYPSAYFSRANLFIMEKNYVNALQDLNKVIILNPEYRGAFFLRGVTQYELQNFNEAINDFDNVLLTNPKNTKALQIKAVSHFRLSQFNEALSFMKRVVLFDEKNDEALFILGVFFSRLNNYEEALLHYNYAIEINSEVASYYNSRALIQSNLLNYYNALDDYTKAIQLCNNKNYLICALYYYNRSIVYSEIGDYDSAIEDLDKAIELNANFGDAYRYRQQIYIALINKTDDVILKEKYKEHAERDYKDSYEIEDLNEQIFVLDFPIPEVSTYSKTKK